jgi:hypothetical protein
MFSSIKDFIKRHRLISRGLTGTSFILDKFGMPIASIVADAGGKIAQAKGWGKKKARKAKKKTAIKKKKK